MKKNYQQMLAKFQHFIFLGTFFFALANSNAFSQGLILPENVDLLYVRPGGLWHADTIFLGAAFLRDTTKTFRVWLNQNDAGWTGTLYLMVPNGKNNGSGDTAISLFTNKAAVGTSVTLSNIPTVQAHIHDLDTVYFMYVSTTGATPATYSGYSGANRRAGDGWVGVDRYTANEKIALTKTGPLGTFVVGRRFCAAGWITTALGRTDTVEFAFEDNHHVAGDGSNIGFVSDLDFNDIIFHVTGLFLMRPPSKITLTVFPKKDTISAGDTIHISAHVLDAFGVDQTQLDAQVQWTLTPAGTASFLRTNNPDSTNTFHAVDAYTWYVIKAFYVDPKNPSVVVDDSVRVYVRPGPPTHLNIEPVSDSTVSLLNDNYLPQHALAIAGTILKDSVYAVLRDAYGNWVSHATLAAWLSRDLTVVTVASTTRTQLGEGEITRVTATTASTIVRASQPVGTATLSDSITVNVSNVLYSQVQIMVSCPSCQVSPISPAGFKIIDSLSMRTDQDTTLHALGLRADGSGIWDDIAVAWGNSTGLTFDNSAPASGQSWTFNPLTPGTGAISIQFTSGTNLLRDSVKVFFIPGLPAKEVLYPLAGQPNTTTPPNQPLPPTVTVVAGTPFQIVAKLFDNKNYWLSAYERTNAPISWTLQEVSGSGATGTMSTTAGYLTVFTGTKAGNVVKITATYQQEAGNNNTVAPQSIIISVVAGPPTHLVIEGDTLQSRSPNADNPVQTVTIGQRDTSVSVYAILRDAYGNWVDYSRATLWASLDATQAAVVNGNTQIGQGIIIRRTPSGQTIVTAKDTIHTGPGFLDSVTVILSNISYDSLRIVVGPNNTVIKSLTMRTDVGDTTLNVQGKRSDNGQWEYVIANWSIVPLLRTSTPAPQATTWRFTPIDTGTGIIVVSKQDAAPDTITVHFLPGLPFSLVLYPRAGAPGGANAAFAPPSTAIIDTAGNPLQMYAKIFDKNGVWLGTYERSSSPVSWNVVELTGNPPTGTLSPTAGYMSAFTPTRAYNTLYVIARLDSAGMTTTARDTVKISVVHAAPSQLVIEADPNWQVKPNTAVPVDTVRIANNQTWVPVYALIRDRFGNFVQYSTNTDWESLNPITLFPGDTSVVSAHNGTNSIGQGIIYRRGASGNQPVTAASLEYAGLADTVQAIVLQYYYLQLRIVVRNDTTRLGTLTMTTNDDTTLKVIGLRSDDSTWEPVSNAKWEISSGLSVPANQAPPGSASFWTFSPNAPGTGVIRVTLGDTTVTKPDYVNATFLVGPPTNITIRIVTPPDSIIAGDTIISIVNIYNKDGLVPGPYCTTTSYQNLLGGVPGYTPLVIPDSVAIKLGLPLNECFNNGVDTVKFILYKAPYNKDSLDKITVVMGTLSAVTDPFLVRPADLNSIAIQDFSGNTLTNVTLVSPTDSKLMIAVGYDKFGNKIGPLENATWSTDGTLHSIDRPQGSRIFYTTDQVLHDEAGKITASVINASEVKITGTVNITITGPENTIVSAITRDNNGDGYLDRIDIQLYSPATIPVRGSQITFTGTYNDPVTGARVTYTTYLTVDSVVSRNGTGTDSLFSIYLVEPKPGEAGYVYPQTGWTPTITIGGIGASALSHVCADGAGPVVWSVVKTITNTSDRSTDLVTVTFSEPIKSGVNDFSLSTMPDLVLQVWKHTTTPDGLRDTIVEVTNMLDSIPSFVQIDQTKTMLSFTMTNKHDLTTRDYINIVWTDSLKRLTDNKTPANSPAEDNRLVQVVVKGTPAEQIIVTPNPSGPNFTHTSSPYNNGPGEFQLAYNPRARDWVRVDRSGVVLTFNIAPSINPSTGLPEKISGYIKIYDMVGNVVQEKTNDDMLPATWADSSVHPFDMYWNGSNSRGMRVAPGIYRAVLYLKYPEFPKPKKYYGTVGIAF
jgi:hypothetical protein